jgi:endonuclease-8
VPEGDTLHRTASVLRAVLLDERVTAARARPGGPQLVRVIGSRIDRVEAVGKHLLIGFDVGLTLHTHLRMEGSWHRYRPGERWRRSPTRAVAVLETPRAVAVCFDAPVAELLETRALPLHPALAGLGPDLLADEPDLDAAVSRLLDPARASLTIAEALLDQTAVAGIGNVYRSEVLWAVRVSPFAMVGAVGLDTLRSLLEVAAGFMRANADSPFRTTMPDALGGSPGSLGPRRGRSRLAVYGRSGRPCPRCGAIVRAKVLGELPRRVYWCPTCQAARPDWTAAVGIGADAERDPAG